MADNQASTTPTPTREEMLNDPKRKAKSNDVGWKYGFWPDLSNKDLVECALCGRHIRSGIKRLKQHLAGNFGDVAKCPKTTTAIMREMQEAIASKKRNKPLDLDDYDEVQEVQRDGSSSGPSIASNAASNTVPSSGTTTKRKKTTFFQFPKPPQKPQNTVETLLRKTPEEVVEERHSGQPSQTTIESHLRTPEEKHRVHMHIAKFLYENGVPFNVTNSRSYEVMVESIGQYGPGLKPPSYHEVRVPLLDDAKKETDELRKRHEAAWKRHGCSLMSDGWTDKRGRHLINFLVNSPEGTYFMDSVDASSEPVNAQYLAKLLDEKIEEIGPENVIQVVSDNGSNYKAAGRILMEKRPTLYWTPCAAHCIDLILEDIGKMKEFKSPIKNAKKITTFIYRHGRLLHAMRDKTHGRDLVRPSATRFATAFLTLQSLYKHQGALRNLFTHEDWTKSKLATTEAGKQVYDLILSTRFWNSVELCIRATQPLIVVLRIVDGDERPALPEVYAAMKYAKEKILDAFDKKENLRKAIVGIIERRWETQMEQKLYGAALFLNPTKYFDLVAKEPNLVYQLRGAFNDVVTKMVQDDDLVNKICAQADAYETPRGNFAKELAIKQRTIKNPIDWWKSFGQGAVELSNLARKILGLCCSASGCERNWSTFEFIHTKKRNRLQHNRLRDLVYVQYNQKIASRFQKRRELGKNFDPLALEEFDWGNEWVNNEGEVHLGEDITWNDVDQAINASNRSQGRNLPRNAQRGHGSTNTYTRRRQRDIGCSTSTETAFSLHDSDSNSDSDSSDAPNLPNDDEDVDDDYGERPPTPSNSNSPLQEDRNALILDDFV